MARRPRACGYGVCVNQKGNVPAGAGRGIRGRREKPFTHSIAGVHGFRGGGVVNSVGSSGFLSVVWAGVRRRCPSCGQATMGQGRRMRESCQHCGWKFFRFGDGDWLVTWLIGYTVASVAMLVSWPLLHFATRLSLTAELAVLALIGAAVVAVLFP